MWVHVVCMCTCVCVEVYVVCVECKGGVRERGGDVVCVAVLSTLASILHVQYQRAGGYVFYPGAGRCDVVSVLCCTRAESRQDGCCSRTVRPSDRGVSLGVLCVVYVCTSRTD